MKNLSAAVFLCLSFLACNRAGSSESGETLKPYFDLKSYFADQITNLQSRSPAIRKRIEVNGKTEEKELTDVDFSEELSIFQRYDINKPAWLDQYRIDSLYEGGQLAGIRYTAKKDDLKTREIDIRFSGNAVQEIRIFNQLNTTSMKVAQELHYNPGKAYSIVNLQKLAFAREKRVSISADFSGGI